LQFTLPENSEVVRDVELGFDDEICFGVFNLKFFDNCTDTLITTESHIDLTIKRSKPVVVRASLSSTAITVVA
jgi:hypothetical protein